MRQVYRQNVADTVLVLSPRPSEVRALVHIELERRTVDTIHTPQFGRYVRMLDAHVKGRRYEGITNDAVR